MTRLIAILIALIVSTPAIAGDSDEKSPAPEGVAVYFIAPADGEVMSGPVTVRFGLSGMGVAPAGVEKANTGHHHLIIDAGLPDLAYAVPKDAHYRHFGGGQTEITLDLAPGTHSLQLLLGDHNHVPHNPAVSSDKITITVE